VMSLKDSFMVEIMRTNANVEGNSKCKASSYEKKLREFRIFRNVLIYMIMIPNLIFVFDSRH
jgi:hypothetical protein